MSFAIIGAIIGFLSAGPIAAVFGFLIGMYLEYAGKQNSNSESTERNTSGNYEGVSDFSHQLLILIAATMNADGSAMKSELELVKRMLVRTYGEYKASNLLIILREMLKEPQDVTQVCRHIRARMAYSQRLELLHILFRISRADAEINPSELQLLNFIATQMAITTPDFLALRAMFVSSPDSDFKILDVSSDAGEDEVKKAYRKWLCAFIPTDCRGFQRTRKRRPRKSSLPCKKPTRTLKKGRDGPEGSRGPISGCLIVCHFIQLGRTNHARLPQPGGFRFSAGSNSLLFIQLMRLVICEGKSRLEI